jgi:hypothetical protein
MEIIEKPEKTAFVIMPFSKTESCTELVWTDIFENIFRPAFEDCGYRCERASTSVGSLIKSIITQLRSSWIVLADLTDRNANVFYELGVRHSLCRRTILVAQKDDHVPSDLRGFWWLTYQNTARGASDFKKEIRRLVTDIEQSPDKSDSPVSEFLEHEMIGVSNYVNKQTVKKLSALFTELSGTINSLRMIPGNSDNAEFISHECLGLLLNTMYVDTGPGFLQQCYALRHNLHSIHKRLAMSPDFITKTISMAEDVLTTVHHLKSIIPTGAFVEPKQVSTMFWQPLKPMEAPEPDAGQVHEFSVSVPFDPIDLDELRRRISDPTSDASDSEER